MLSPQDTATRETKLLDGLWASAADPAGSGRIDGWWRHPVGGARPVAVPASYNDLFADRTDHDLVDDACLVADRRHDRARRTSTGQDSVIWSAQSAWCLPVYRAPWNPPSTARTSPPT